MRHAYALGRVQMWPLAIIWAQRHRRQADAGKSATGTAVGTAGGYANSSVMVRFVSIDCTPQRSTCKPMACCKVRPMREAGSARPAR